RPWPAIPCAASSRQRHPTHFPCLPLGVSTTKTSSSSIANKLVPVMGQAQSSQFCSTCSKQVLAARPAINHVLHLLLSLLCLCWLPIWLILAIQATLTPWRCQVCGQPIPPVQN